MIILDEVEIKNFNIKELVPKSVYDKYGEFSWRFLDKQAVIGLQLFREWWGVPVMVNNWHNGGRFHNRGFRMPNTTVGAFLSQHKFGRAWDLNVRGIPSDDVYDSILADEDYFFEIGITRMEKKKYTKGWTHIDFALTTFDHIQLIRP